MFSNRFSPKNIASLLQKWGRKGNAAMDRFDLTYTLRDITFLYLWGRFTGNVRTQLEADYRLRPQEYISTSEGIRYHQSAAIDPSAKIGEGTIIGPGVVIKDGVHVGPNAAIGNRVVLDVHADIGAEVRIGEGSVVGSGTVVYPNVFVGSNTSIGQRNKIGYCNDRDRGKSQGTKIGNGVHTDHNVFMQYGVEIGNNVVIANHTKIERYPNCPKPVSPLKIGAGTQIGASVYIGVGMGSRCIIADGAHVEGDGSYALQRGVRIGNGEHLSISFVEGLMLGRCKVLYREYRGQPFDGIFIPIRGTVGEITKLTTPRALEK